MCPTLPPEGPQAAPDWSAAAAEVLAILARAERPLVVVGGSHWSQEAADDLGRFAAAQGLPVAAGFRRQDMLDNRHPCYAGDFNVTSAPGLARRLREADALLLLGLRMGDIETGGYRLLDPAAPGKRIIHVHPDPDEPGRVWRPDLWVSADAPSFLRALAALPPARSRDDGPAAHAEWEDWRRPRETPGAVKQEQLVRWLSDHLPEDAILTNGAGNFAAFLHRYFAWKRWGTQLAPGSGSMGYGFPAAIAASLHHPGRTVVCWAGDGDIQMTLTEMSTARQHGATPIVVVMNNGVYGTIRMHQEREYPARVSGTALWNPDYAALARAYGAHGERVERTEEFAAAFGRARASGLPAIIECRLDVEALTPGRTLSEIRAG